MTCSLLWSHLRLYTTFFFPFFINSVVPRTCKHTLTCQIIVKSYSWNNDVSNATSTLRKALHAWMKELRWNNILTEFNVNKIKSLAVAFSFSFTEGRIKVNEYCCTAYICITALYVSALRKKRQERQRQKDRFKCFVNMPITPVTQNRLNCLHFFSPIIRDILLETDCNLIIATSFRSCGWTITKNVTLCNGADVKAISSGTLKALSFRVELTLCGEKWQFLKLLLSQILWNVRSLVTAGIKLCICMCMHAYLCVYPHKDVYGPRPYMCRCRSISALIYGW